ncbi:MAG: 3-isopropylmalate dehydratase small subunit [Deltaproteobacteria bacterium]|nr:3-isopropylmalate dehydratase small subunit [Deltaproteobacteria bacterium]
MKPLDKLEGVAALIDKSNIDTDQIIPKQFLKKVERTGFGVHLFHDWRYLADGSDNPDFDLNKPSFKDASILVAGDNFGCGSSREHAPWALEDYGFRVIISTSFADIFHSNCFKNGILPIMVNENQLKLLMDEIRQNEGVSFLVDLENQQVATPSGTYIQFDIDPFRKEGLLKGLDNIAWSLSHEDDISRFETEQKKTAPWLWN